MRQERAVQASLFDLFAAHEIGRELKAMSLWLDEHRDLIGLAAEDLRRHGVTETGRQGLPAESVMRCGLLKQHRQLSYEELAFHLEDSASFRAFARLPLSWTPKKSVLHKTISAIRAETWEAINRILLDSAREEKVETGKVVRLDSTVTAALMHEPSDSNLLWDAVRVMARLLREADALIGARLVWRDHQRAAKKRARAIEYARSRANRVQHYRELMRLTRATLAYADQAAMQLWQAPDPIAAALWPADAAHAIERPADQLHLPGGQTIDLSDQLHASVIDRALKIAVAVFRDSMFRRTFSRVAFTSKSPGSSMTVGASAATSESKWPGSANPSWTDVRLDRAASLMAENQQEREL
jgi:transposase, IS5 family